VETKLFKSEDSRYPLNCSATNLGSKYRDFKIYF